MSHHSGVDCRFEIKNVQLVLSLFQNIMYFCHDMTCYKLMNSFLSPLSERREMRDPIKPSGPWWEMNPGPLAPESCVLPMRHSTSTYNHFFLKDAGFVQESFWIDMKWTFLTFFSYKTNPQNESFEHCRTKRIHKMNLLNTIGQNKSTKQIFWTPKVFANPEVLDSYGFVSL